MPVPSNVTLNVEFQDNRGFRSNTRLNGYLTDISADSALLSDIYAWTAAVATDIQAMSNAKSVKTSVSFDWAIAQEPSSETGTYQLVTQKARLEGGDGHGGYQSIQIPAPKDALFLTIADNNLIVVNPAAATLTQFQTDLANHALTFYIATARLGVPFSQFFGGQLDDKGPRRRRVLQGQ